jgi:hypothetical protein
MHQVRALERAWEWRWEESGWGVKKGECNRTRGACKAGRKVGARKRVDHKSMKDAQTEAKRQ